MSKATTRNSMKTAQRIALADYLRQTYAGCGKTDAEFALSASEALGFEVNANNVNGMRASLGIESEYDRINRERAEQREAERLARESEASRSGPTIIERIAELERQTALMNAAIASIASSVETALANSRRLLTEYGINPDSQPAPMGINGAARGAH